MHSDIWSVDIDKENYRIGNRYGVYKSNDLNIWHMENQGFAYKMIRKNENLYVSGMGSKNRLYNEKKWSVLEGSPHMFRDIVQRDKEKVFFTPRNKELKVPIFKNATLYSLLLTLHDGSFFAPWWVWINDYAAIALLIISLTGTLRWYRKKRVSF